jgi:hypothetical protein
MARSIPNLGASYTNPVVGKMYTLDSADAVTGIVELKTDSSDLDSDLPNGGCTGSMKDLASTTEESRR